MKLSSWKDVSEEAWRDLSLTLPELSEPSQGLWSAGQFLQEIQSSPILWADVREGEIAGVISMRQLDADTFEIVYLYTAPKWRRQHVMECLMLEVIENLSQGSRLWLEVAATNETAQALYKKLGFVHQGVRPGYYSDRTDSWLYRYFEEARQS